MFQQPVADRDLVAIPDELKLVPPGVLENYVTARIRSFSRVFAQQLSPSASAMHVETAFSRSILFMTPAEKPAASLSLKLKHRCRHTGCKSAECLLCKDNPLKACSEGEVIDEYYTLNTPIRSRCGAEISIELNPSAQEWTQQLAGLHLLVSVVDGDSDNLPDSLTPSAYMRPTELSQSDAGEPLLAGAPGAMLDAQGRLLLPFKGSRVRLSGLRFVHTNETFVSKMRRFSSYRLLLRAVRVDPGSTNHTIVPEIREMSSSRFMVKRAAELETGRPTEYPHTTDNIRKLRYMSREGAEKLMNLRAFLGQEVPEQLLRVETVGQLAALLQLAGGNPALREKVVSLLGFEGSPHHWQWLCQVVLNNQVEDDNYLRVWYKDEQKTKGLLFSCRQGQVQLDTPIALVHRLVLPNFSKMVVDPLPEGHESASEMSTLTLIAQLAWSQPFHPGWYKIDEPLEWTGMTQPPPQMLLHPLPITGMAAQEPLSGPPCHQSPTSSDANILMSSGSSGIAHPMAARSSETGAGHVNFGLEHMALVGGAATDPPAFSSQFLPINAVPATQLHNAEQALADARRMLQDMRGAFRAAEAEKPPKRGGGGGQGSHQSPFFPPKPTLRGVRRTSSTDNTITTTDTESHGIPAGAGDYTLPPGDSTSRALERLGLSDTQPATSQHMAPASEAALPHNDSAATMPQAMSTATGSGDGSHLMFQQSSGAQSTKRSRDGSRSQDGGDLNGASNTQPAWTQPNRVVLYHSESGGRHLPIGRIERGESAPLAIINSASNNEETGLGQIASSAAPQPSLSIFPSTNNPSPRPLSVHHSAPADALANAVSLATRPLQKRFSDSAGPSPFTTQGAGPGPGPGSGTTTGAPGPSNPTQQRPRYPVVLDVSDAPPPRFPSEPRFANCTEPLPPHFSAASDNGAHYTLAAISSNMSSGLNASVSGLSNHHSDSLALQGSQPGVSRNPTFEDPSFNGDPLSNHRAQQQGGNGAVGAVAGTSIAPPSALPSPHPAGLRLSSPHDTMGRPPLSRQRPGFPPQPSPDTPPVHHTPTPLPTSTPFTIHASSNPATTTHPDNIPPSPEGLHLTSTPSLLRNFSISDGPPCTRVLRHQDTDSFKRIIPDLVSPHLEGSGVEKFLASHAHLPAHAASSLDADPTNLLEEIEQP